jgi:hypothetical protein
VRESIPDIPNQPTVIFSQDCAQLLILRAKIHNPSIVIGAVRAAFQSRPCGTVFCSAQSDAAQVSRLDTSALLQGLPTPRNLKMLPA